MTKLGANVRSSGSPGHVVLLVTARVVLSGAVRCGVVRCGGASGSRLAGGGIPLPAVGPVTSAGGAGEPCPCPSPLFGCSARMPPLYLRPSWKELCLSMSSRSAGLVVTYYHSASP